MRWIVLLVVLSLVLASGCTSQYEPMNGTEETEYVYANLTNNTSIGDLTGGKGLGFVFKLYINSMKLPPGNMFTVPIIFNNIEEDKKPHKFVARFFPSEVDFNVKAAYECQWFQACPELKSDMAMWVSENKNQVEVDYGFVGLKDAMFTIPEDTPRGTYIYTAVACKDIPYEECSQETSNWGPNLLFTITVE